MNPNTLARRIGAVVLGAAVVTLVVASCGKNKIVLPQVANLSPTVRLTQAPIDTTSENFYSITLNWVGYDQDGRVDHYLYAVDPPEQALAETTWTSSNENEKRLTFSAGHQVAGPDADTKSRDFHTFVIAAVDDRGAVGPRVFRAFFTYTTAPTVNILSPRPSALTNPLLPPSVRITWSGQDVDGVFTTRPVYYKYLLVNSGTLPPGISTIDQLISNPSLFRTVYAPNFEDSLGWVRTSAESTTVQFTNLNPGEQYLFVVVAFDEAGAYSPVFTLDNSVLRFKVGFAATRGPRICMFNEFFFYCYPSGGYTVAPQAERKIEVPEGQPIRFFWFADPPEGASIRCYRWLLDGDVFDETPRTDELNDTQHWSTCSGSLFSATVGPFFVTSDTTTTDHYFYIEAQDNIGLKSLGIVHFNVVKATLERPMLIVDDTRLNADRFNFNRAHQAWEWLNPLGRWPTAAELDTFLFARGGVDWNYAYENHPIALEHSAFGPYPPGTLTKPGLFSGYDYDTLGTRIGRADLTVPLSVLGKYKHVIWIVDGNGATNSRSGTDGTQPSTALRYMSASGRVNTLGALVKQGGLVWVTGGGGAFANLIPNNDPANDRPTTTFSKITGQARFRELDAGRMMYDLAKWQSEIRIANAPTKPIRNLGRFRDRPGLYALLPDSLEPKTPFTDPLPPLRNNSDFYVQNFDFEFLQQDNVFTEPIQTDPVDFVIDTFNETDPTLVARRWISSDTLNTLVSQDPVGQTGRAMLIATQGSGASVGDRVARTFTPPKDWSGLVALRFAIKQSQPTSALQWRVRIVDEQGASLAALVPVTATGTYQQMDIRLRDFVTDSRTQPSLVSVSRLEFEPVTATAAATTSIDQVAVAMTFDAPVLDTLYSAVGGGSTSLPINNVTMTYYHGHDSTPFVFTGFSIWMYKRAQCQQLIDFVLQRLWGMSKSGSAPALRARSIAPTRVVSTVARPGPSRISPPIGRGPGKVTAAQRAKTAPGTRK